MSHLKEQPPERLATLCEHSLKKFCEGYSMMFDKPFTTDLSAIDMIPSSQLTADYSGILAVNQIVCSGPAEGSFLIILDKTALFTLGGATIMLPQPRIKESCDRGTAEDAIAMADSVGEIGNLLVGELSITFRIGVDDASGFGDTQRLLLKLPVSVGDISVQPEEGVALYHVMEFEMNLGGFDPFKLRVAFPGME